VIGDKTAPDLPALRDDEPATLPQIEGVRALLALTEPVACPPRDAVIPAVSQVPRRGSHRASGGAVARRHAWTRLPWPLLGVLAVQAGLSIRLIWSNTAFSDEALYLWAGRLEWQNWLHGTPIPDFPTYFSGAPVIYPPLGALMDALGGLTAARALSLAFMLVSTILLYDASRRIFGRPAALFAASLFAGLAATQYLGAFATYDAMALMLLALATWLAVRGAERRSQVATILLFSCSSVILVLADATKYAAGLFDPIVIAIAVVAALRGGWRLAVMAGTAYGIVFAAVILTALHFGGHAYWQGITSTTLTRAEGSFPVFGILYVSAGWIGQVMLLAVAGAVAAACTSCARHTKMLAAALALASFLPPAEQARIHVFTSLFKHVGFGAWFGACVAGYALAAFTKAVAPTKRRNALTVAIAVLPLCALAGFQLAETHFGNWPDESPVLSPLDAAIQRHPGTLLADDGPTFDYYLEGVESWRQIDPVHSGTSLATYAAGIRSHRYSVIMQSFDGAGGGCTSATEQRVDGYPACVAPLDAAILEDINHYGGYELAARVPYATTSFRSVYLLWVREPSRASAHRRGGRT
jgi:hypothetical protein